MQRAEVIRYEDLPLLIEAIFSNGEVEVYESYSDMEQELIQISGEEEFIKYVEGKIKSGFDQLSFSLYYPETKGFFEIVKIDLNPRYCNGKTYRYKVSGWGLIQLFIDFRKSNLNIKCRIAVNSEERAKHWESTSPELLSHELWDWKIIESKTRKLIYRLKKLRQ